MSTATPVIDKATTTIYMLSADGRLHGLDIATGEAKLVPPPEFVTPYSRNWSLNLVDGVLYTTVGQRMRKRSGAWRAGAAARHAAWGRRRRQLLRRPATRLLAQRGAPARDARTARVPAHQRRPVHPSAPARGRGRGTPPPPVAAHMIAMDLKSPSRPVSRLFTSTARPNGAWSRAGLAWAHDSLLVQTADGAWEPARRPVGADAASARAQNAERARLLHAAQSRKSSMPTTSTTDREARWDSPSRIARSSSRAAKTERSTCSTQNRSAAPIIGRRSFR